MSLEGKKSKRGRVGEGRPTKRTPEVVAKLAEAVAIGLTDEEAALLAGINPDTMTEWRKDPEFSGAIKRATAQRLKLRLERIEAGKPVGRELPGRSNAFIPNASRGPMFSLPSKSTSARIQGSGGL